MGILKGDSIARVRSLFPDIRVLTPSLDEYEKVNKQVESHICRLFPLYEPEDMGKIYIDYTGMEKLYGDPKDLGLKLHGEIKQKFALSSMIGVSDNKFVSRLVADTLPEREKEPVLEIFREQVCQFLSPLNVSVIPPIKSIERKK